MGNSPSVGSYGGTYFYSSFGNQLTGDIVLIIPLGYSSPPAPSSASSWTPIQLNPLLDSRSPQCLNFDIAALPFMPNMNGPAVHPPVTFIQLLIFVQPFKWSVNIHVPGPVTVFQVVQHLSEYLQGYENPQDLQKYKTQIPSGYSHSSSLRDQNNPSILHSGNRRIDLLGRQRIFRGLSPGPGGPGPNCAWVVHLSDR